MINLNITDEYRIVVPLRWERFNHGQLSARDCPEIDDRGYFIRRTSAWGAPAIRGPMFGMMKSHEVRVRILHEDIDSGAPLFATSAHPDLLEIMNVGGAIAADGELKVKGKARGTATINIRLGATDGPILADCDVRVSNRLRVPIKPWLVRIDSTTVTGTTPVFNIDPVFERCRAIWRPAGIDFTLRPTSNATVRLPSNQADRFNNLLPYAQDTASVLNVQNSTGVAEKAIHWFIIDRFTGSTVGRGISRQTANDNALSDTGIITAVNDNGGTARNPEATARTLAHEIGHFFRLEHARLKHSNDPAKDTYSFRQLMFPLSFFDAGTNGPAVPRVSNVGYGTQVRGCLLTMKDFVSHSTDGEVATARNAIQSDNWF